MKKTYSKTFMAALAALAFVSEAEAAELSNLKPYVGIDLMRTVYDYNDNYDIGGGLALDGDAILEDALDGLNIHVGVRPHQFFGLELGYFRTREEGKSIASGAAVGPGTVATADFSTDVKVQGLTLDGLGYLPLGAQERFELIGTAGVSWSKAEVTATVPGAGSGDVDESEFGFRVGGGAQFNINENFNVRGIARYQTADFEDVADNAWTYTLGVNYSF